MEKSVKTIFNQLKGTWTLRRKLITQQTKIVLGQVIGTAEFSQSADENKLCYEEKGNYTPANGDEVSITAKYFYVYDPEHQTLSIFFNQDNQEGLLFHRLDFNNAGNEASGQHVCSRDYYQARYQFFKQVNENFNNFEITYTVNGPQKSYISHTTFKQKSSGY